MLKGTDMFVDIFIFAYIVIIFATWGFSYSNTSSFLLSKINNSFWYILLQITNNIFPNYQGF